MGSENTSDFEVRKSKSRKRTKIRKGKSEDTKSQVNSDTNITTNGDDKTGETTEVVVERTQQKGYKRKSNDKILKNGLDHRATQSKTGEIDDIDKTHKSLNNLESLTEEKTPKRHKRRSTVSIENNDNADTDTPKTPSNRQIKREKAEQREAEKREASKAEATQKALTYVTKWKFAKSQWKFEKFRQLWLINNLLDDTLIPDEIFPIVLEYFEGCKGMAREELLKKGMDVVRIAEEEVEKRDEIIESVSYKRARLLLQALPTET